MASLNLNMNDTLRQFVDERAQAGGYSTPTEYVRSLIRDDKKRAAQERLDKLIVEGLESGTPVEVTPEDWNEIRQTARNKIKDRSRKKHEPKD